MYMPKILLYKLKIKHCVDEYQNKTNNNNTDDNIIIKI